MELCNLLRSLFLLFASLLLTTCSSTDKSAQKVPSSDSVQAEQPPGPPKIDRQRIPPATTKENVTLIGAVVESIELVDSVQFKVAIELRTAIPAGGAESIAEPGQRITVIPAYMSGEAGSLDMSNDRNKRLFDVRSLKQGDFLLGKISLSQNGKWYLIDTKLD